MPEPGDHAPPPDPGNRFSMPAPAVLEQIVLHAPDPLLVADGDALRWISPSIQDVLGWPRDGVTIGSLTSLCHAEDQGTVRALIGKAVAGESHRGIVRMRAHDRAFMHVLLSLGPGDSGSDASVVGSIREVDARIRAEAEQAAAFDDCRVLADRSGDAVLRIDDRGKITWASASVSDLLGWHPGELVGRSAGEFAHPLDAPALTAAWSIPQTGERPERTLFRALSKDGSWRWVEHQGHLVPERAMHRSHLVSLLRDMQAEVQAREVTADTMGHQRAMIDSMIDPFTVLKAVRDAEGAIVDLAVADANTAACQAYGNAHGDVIGRPLLDLLSPAGEDAMGDTDASAARALIDELARLVEHPGPFIRDDWAYPGRTGQGTGRHFDVRAVPFDDGLALTWRDVTERTDLTRRVAHSEARLRAVMDSMVDPQVLIVPVTGEAGEVVDFAFEEVNIAACEYLGASAQDMIGRRVRESLAGLIDSGLFASLVDVARNGVPATIDDHRVADPVTRENRVVDVRCTQVQVDQVSLTWRDVTERHLAARVLAESEAQLRTIINAASVGMAQMQLDGQFMQVNPALCRMVDRPADWLVRRGMEDILHPEDAEQDRRMREELGSGHQDSLTWEERLVRADGHTIWVLHSLAVIRGLKGMPSSYVGYFVDVTVARRARDRIASSERQYRLVAENSSDVIAHLREGVINWISPSVVVTFGGSIGAWVGRRLRDAIHPFDLHAFDDALSRAARGESPKCRIRLCSDDGTYHWIDSHFAPFLDESRNPDGVSASMRNVDVEVQALAELDEQARHDTLTGLINRREAMQRIKDPVAMRREPGGQLAVLFCDIDHFKEINDRLGHLAGDAVLRAIAKRITDAVRLNDVVARMGGDEILVLIAGVHSLDEASAVAEKVRALAHQPIAVDGQQVTTSLSIGVTLADPHESVDGLIARADSAMYRAKRAGRNQVMAIYP